MADPKKKLGFGIMRLPELPDKEYDKAELQSMIDCFVERGFTYFDMAWAYARGLSEVYFGEMVAERYPREAYSAASKLHSAFVKSFEDRDRIFEEQLRRTHLEYFDYYLLHGIQDNSIEVYEKYDCFEWIRAKKEAGLAKEIGFSFHGTPELLDRLLTDYPFIEFVQLQINYLDWESRLVRGHECYDICRKHGKPVHVMEPVKGGTLANLPEDIEARLKEADPDASPASWAIRYAASLPGVRVVLSGMTHLEQTQDNTSFMSDFKPLDESEMKLLADIAAEMNSRIAIPCTSCRYCTDGCPMGIAIPDYFTLYNHEMQESVLKWTPAKERYEVLIKTHGRANECIACGQCEGVCPQHLPIIENLKLVSARFDA